jgi:predicted short-subunit dehydrogenase-like oxidoreductase (DUF2520 family)
MHPLQTFPSVDAGIERLPGTYCFIEGDERAVAALEGLAGAISAKPMRTTAEGKALYHASAAVASNYLVALLDAAAGLMAMSVPANAGMNRAAAIAALEPLVRATVENVMAMGPARALTGPIARGDAGTIQRHLEAMGRATPELLPAYCAMGKLTLELALRAGGLEDAAAAKIARLLDEASDKPQ